MADQDEDDSFIKDFMRRAKERDQKMKEIASELERPTMRPQEVSYPPLSPLPEENSGIESPEVDQNESSISDDDREENVSPDDDDDSRLNYSSDLSLDCEASDVYRAEPVVCHSSPEHQFTVPAQNRQPSPRKQKAPSCPPSAAELTVPLHERQQEQKATSSQSLPEQGQNEIISKELQRKVDRAEHNKQQLRKAVEISRHGSKEHIEAARLLQIAELEHQIFTHHLKLYTQGDRAKKSESLGSIKVQNIKLKITSKLRNDLAEEGVLHNFFIIVSCGTEIKATEIVDTERIRHQDLKAYIQFNDCVTFADLPPDFNVKLEVFELVIRQHSTKLLSRLTPSKKSKITPDAHFKRVGSMRLTLADRDSCYKNLTQWSEYEKSKYIEKECKFNLELKPEQLPCRAGMLHVRCFDTEGLPDWSRYWVDLSEGLLRFWKARQDALDGKKPNQVLELGDMCCEAVQKLGPTDDLYRQNSFVVYTLQQVAGGDKNSLFQCILDDDPKFKLVKHQLAAENKEDRDSWSTILDRSMRCYREWNGATKVYSIDEVRAIFGSSN